MRGFNFVSVAIVCAGLAACQTGPKGVRVVNGGTSAYTDKPGAKISDFNAGQIGQAIIGKTFQYTRADGNGFATYNADGTIDIQDDNKGETKGRWSASGSQYCEVFGTGAEQECGVFKNTGDAYFAAKSRLVEMKV